MHASAAYNLAFAAAICVICAIFVSSSAELLKELQEINETLERQRNVLIAAGLASSDERLSQEEVDTRFESIHQIVIDLKTGAEVSGIDPNLFDQRLAATNVSTSSVVPDNHARVARVPNRALVYELLDTNGALERVILPVSGMGLWATLYGFIAFDSDLETIKNITFYEHKETPGLGGEVDNPRWKNLWSGRKAFDRDNQLRIEVIKGRAGPPDTDPHRVDGLAGATMTSRGVTNMLHFWLGEHGFHSYLERLRNRGDR